MSDREWLQFCIDEARHFRQDGKADALERIAAALNQQAGVMEALRPLEEALAKLNACNARTESHALWDVATSACNAIAAVKGVES